MREQLAFAAEDLPIALDSLKAITQGAVILSTCNRTEIYALAPEGQTLTSTMSQVIEWLAAFKNTPMQKSRPTCINIKITMHCYIGCG